MIKILLLVAHPKEVPVFKVPGNFIVKTLITGIGSVKVKENLLPGILEFNPDIIINLGTCCSNKKYDIGTVLYVTDSASSLPEKSEVFNLTSGSKVICLTSPTPVDRDSKISSKYDIIDMELYDIIELVKPYKINTYAIKVVSDVRSDLKVFDYNIWKSTVDFINPILGASLENFLNNLWLNNFREG